MASSSKISKPGGPQPDGGFIIDDSEAAPPSLADLARMSESGELEEAEKEASEKINQKPPPRG